jgi:hypothetical protein
MQLTSTVKSCRYISFCSLTGSGGVRTLEVVAADTQNTSIWLYHILQVQVIENGHCLSVEKVEIARPRVSKL